MRWAQRGWTVLGAVLGVLLLGPAYSWATHEHATGCWIAPGQDTVRCWIPGQDWTAVQRLDLDLDNAGVYGSHVLSLTGLTITAQSDGSRVISGSVFGYGPSRSLITHARLWADSNRWDDPMPVAVPAVEASYPPADLDPSPEPSPTPSPSPAEPSPSPSPSSDTSTVTTSPQNLVCESQGCVVRLDGTQYLVVMTGLALVVMLLIVQLVRAEAVPILRG